MKMDEVITVFGILGLLAMGMIIGIVLMEDDNDE